MEEQGCDYTKLNLPTEMTNIDPPDEIQGRKQTKQFRGLYQKCVQGKFHDFPESSKRETLREEIDTEKRHRKLISYSIFPFTQGEPAGYKFIAVEPLAELGVKNVDFLLYDMDGHAILGEAKSSIPKQAPRVVNELSNRRSTVFENIDYIEDTYLGDQIEHMEFVLVTYVQHSDKIAKEIAEQGERIITWTVDPHSDTIWINQARPREFPDNLEADSPDEMLQELNRRLTHSVNELNSRLDRATTSLGQVDILPNAPTVDRLRAVVQARRVEGRHPCIDRYDIIDHINDSMLNYDGGRIARLVDDLIEAGKRIDFLSEWDNSAAEFKIVSNYTDRDDLETALENKWVDYRIERMKDELRNECYEAATRDVGKQTQLPDFSES